MAGMLKTFSPFEFFPLLFECPLAPKSGEMILGVNPTAKSDMLIEMRR